MPQSAYNHIHGSHSPSGNIEYFVHASDTSNGRRAGYAAYVVFENGVYYARTAYGSLGTRYRTTDLGAHANLNAATREVNKAFQGKLKKNYREDYNIVQQPTSSTPQPQSSVSATNPLGLAETVTVFSHYTPGLVYVDPYTTSAIFDDKVVFEWYPEAMRCKIFAFYANGIGVYNLSGQIEDTIKYPIGYDNTTADFLEIVSNGLIFTGYTDPNDNIVLLRYISEGHNQRGTEVINYSKQRNILLMVLYTLTLDSAISVTSVDSPIYANTRIVLSTDKEEVIKVRKPLNRFANNLIMFGANDNMTVLNCIER